jgi:hypothetical protein
LKAAVAASVRAAWGGAGELGSGEVVLRSAIAGHALEALPGLGRERLRRLVRWAFPGLGSRALVTVSRSAGLMELRE